MSEELEQGQGSGEFERGVEREKKEQEKQQEEQQPQEKQPQEKQQQQQPQKQQQQQQQQLVTTFSAGKSSSASTAKLPAPVYVRQVHITEVEKRSKPTKHYAYVLRIQWSTGKRTTAIRSHNDFFHFHVRTNGVCRCITAQSERSSILDCNHPRTHRSGLGFFCRLSSCQGFQTKRGKEVGPGPSPHFQVNATKNQHNHNKIAKR